MTHEEKVLSTDDLAQRFGPLYLEVLFQKGDVRTSCVRRVSDDAVLAGSIVFFSQEGISLLGQELHARILGGGKLGEVIQTSGVSYERTVAAYTKVSPPFGIAFLFSTKDQCLMRRVSFLVEGILYASIIEFYNPSFTLPQEEIFSDESFDVLNKPWFFLAPLKDGYDDEYLRLTHGFLKKAMHVGIENQDEHVRATRDTLVLLKQDQNTKIFVMADGERFVGYVAINIHPALHLNGLECIVREIYVLEDFQRSGIGRALMSYVERYAQKNGCKRISLATNWGDEKQKGFYESLGFVRRCDFVTKYF